MPVHSEGWEHSYNKLNTQLTSPVRDTCRQIHFNPLQFKNKKKKKLSYALLMNAKQILLHVSLQKSPGMFCTLLLLSSLIRWNETQMFGWTFAHEFEGSLWNFVYLTLPTSDLKSFQPVLMLKFHYQLPLNYDGIKRRNCCQPHRIKYREVKEVSVSLAVAKWRGSFITAGLIFHISIRTKNNEKNGTWGFFLWATCLCIISCWQEFSKRI